MENARALFTARQWGDIPVDIGDRSSGRRRAKRTSTCVCGTVQHTVPTMRIYALTAAPTVPFCSSGNGR
ncbi:MAG: hypothetical protein KatS3mg058_3471 [Roseiflexus sp.]|nr:MAG: hypothetical protein KatS3mg058_3471 [Roseiflexus sp.]